MSKMTDGEKLQTLVSAGILTKKGNVTKPYKGVFVKTKQSVIPRDPLKVPKPLSNPAAALIRDTIAHHGITQTEAAEAMKVSKAQLSDVIRQRKGVSANLALRAQFCLGIPGDLLIRLQAQFDYQKAFHAKNTDIQKEVRTIFAATQS